MNLWTECGYIRTSSVEALGRTCGWPFVIGDITADKRTIEAANWLWMRNFIRRVGRG